MKTGAIVSCCCLALISCQKSFDLSNDIGYLLTNFCEKTWKLDGKPYWKTYYLDGRVLDSEGKTGKWGLPISGQIKEIFYINGNYTEMLYQIQFINGSSLTLVQKTIPSNNEIHYTTN